MPRCPVIQSHPRRWRRVSAALAVSAVALLAGTALAAPAVAAGSTADGQRYLVRRGDTLSEIAVAHHTSVAALASANGIPDPQVIYAGTWLEMPAGGGATGAGTGHYTVQQGDTLSGIAARFGLSVSTLAGANGLNDPDRILAGSHLAIPRTSSDGAPVATASQREDLPPAMRAHPERRALAPVFDRWAAAYGIPANLLKALAWMESGWQRTVVSPVGAIGICQLMPATTLFVSRDLIGTTLDPWNASDNIRLGARYLRYLLDRAHGDVRIAVASYYQGYASVTRQGMYSDTLAYVDGILGLARLPFANGAA